MDKKPLTGRQMAVLNFILDHMKKKGYPPTILEICAAFKFKSPNAGQFYIETLVRKGWLIRRQGVARGLVPA